MNHPAAHTAATESTVVRKIRIGVSFLPPYYGPSPRAVTASRKQTVPVTHLPALCNQIAIPLEVPMRVSAGT